MPFHPLLLAAVLGRSAPEILFYGTGIAVLVAITFFGPHRGGRFFRKVEKGIAALARRRGLAVFTAGLISFSIAAGMAAMVGLPKPKVDDEFCYLLAADTFTRGRLFNPQHPLWEHFETFHVLQDPVYTSKYPPGQGLLLSVGKLIAHPAVGLWLGAALASAAITWMLMAWLPARWALLGGLLVAVHPEILVWSQRYWGGCLATAGGALTLGGFRRILNQPQSANPLPMMVGIIGTLFTRPYEGTIMTALLGSVLLVSFTRKGFPLPVIARRAVLPVAAALAVAVSGWGIYNYRVVGTPFRMPYQFHVAQYMAAPLFIWQSAPPLPSYRHDDIRDFHTGWEYNGYAKQRSAGGLATGFIERTWRLVRGYMRIWFLSISFIALPWALRRDRWMKLAMVLTVLFFSALLLVNWTFFHYATPLFGLFFFCAIQCMRHLRLWRWHGKPTGLFLARTSIVFCVLAVFQTGSDIARAYPDWWWMRRQEILDQLHHDGGRHLIVIRYAPGIVNSSSFRDWTRNDADIDGAEIVWARSMDADRNRQLLDYYKDRRAWLLDVRPDGVNLLPWPG